MAMQTLTAVFTSRDGAIAAASELRRRGLSSTVALSPEAAGTAVDAARDIAGFLAWFEKLLGDAADRETYSLALGRGDTVLTAVVPPTGLHGALGVLDHHLSIRVDRCRRTWGDAQEHDPWQMDTPPIILGGPQDACQADRRASTPSEARGPHRPTDEATRTRIARYFVTLPSDDEKTVL